MKSPILSERQLLISPTLAATIGLEEAVMLQAIADLIEYREKVKRNDDSALIWIKVSYRELESLLSFWDLSEIKRIQESLQNLGMIRIEPLNSNVEILLAINDQVHPKEKPRRGKQRPKIPPSANSAGLVPVDWQPDQNWIRLCKQHSIPEDFIKQLVPEFVNYWRDRGQSRFSWGNAFYKHVLKEWRNEQTRRGAHELASTMSADWTPSPEAMGILENAGINPSFIQDAVPEFVLYWRERGAVHGAWNTKFIEHIRRQWAKFTTSFGRDDTPKQIPDDWHPSLDCYEILQLAEINEEWARSRVPEFVLYWKDRQQVKSSWNTVFLQFIKQDWARQLKHLESAEIANAENQSITGSGQQRLKEKFQQFADRSWAE
ncbi:MAG: hypothetical protein CMQ28_00890 [Gammaproteobacteria bacterium]|nr:hypothetical protein [Gammaproteobacteria bacterium]|tara:strand:+ start:3463 stop:4587 length:1125 start_codon:yes stop_codon:yes gene_type:complete